MGRELDNCSGQCSDKRVLGKNLFSQSSYEQIYIREVVSAAHDQSHTCSRAPYFTNNEQTIKLEKHKAFLKGLAGIE